MRGVTMTAAKAALATKAKSFRMFLELLGEMFS
jgi:hypothetical protein